jgi:hypothetical protein
VKPFSDQRKASEAKEEWKGSKVFVDDDSVPNAVMCDGTPERTSQERRVEDRKIFEPPASKLSGSSQCLPAAQVETMFSSKIVPQEIVRKSTQQYDNFVWDSLKCHPIDSKAFKHRFDKDERPPRDSHLLHQKANFSFEKSH